MNLIIQDFLYLLPGNTGKPRKKLRDRRPVAQVLKQRRHRDTCATKSPRATENIWRPLDSIEMFK